MRYSREHKLETHARIVKKASVRLREKGAHGIGVADLMKEAGLTHGGFYAHFDSREALVIEAFNYAMDLAMELPIKVSAATSNFMIGVTAAASAGVYFARGQIDPFITAPVALGVLAGALVGSYTMGRIGSRAVRIIFVIVLVLISVQMLLKGIHG